MKQTIRKLVLVGGLALPFGGIALAADLTPRPPESEPISNAHREMQILSAFGRNAQLRVFDFSVSVDVDRVVLGGTVDDDINKNLAGRIAIDVGGIKFVVNHIVVDADTRLQRAPRD